MKDNYDFLRATMMLEELGFSEVYLDVNNSFAVYYNGAIKTICSVEDYHGQILCYLDSSNLTQEVFTQDIKLLPGMFFMLKKGAFLSNNRKISISRAHIVSEKEVDEIGAKNRNIKKENLDFNFLSKSDTDVYLSLLLKHLNLNESEYKALEYLKLSRLEQMPEEVKSMIDCNFSYYQKNGNSFVNRILRGK